MLLCKFDTLQLMLPDAQKIPLSDLQFHQPHFTLHLDHFQPNDVVEEFKGVIGQDRELIHYSSAHHEVCVNVACSYTLSVLASKRVATPLHESGQYFVSILTGVSTQGIPGLAWEGSKMPLLCS